MERQGSPNEAHKETTWPSMITFCRFLQNFVFASHCNVLATSQEGQQRLQWITNQSTNEAKQNQGKQCKQMQQTYWPGDITCCVDASHAFILLGGESRGAEGLIRKFQVKLNLRLQSRHVCPCRRPIPTWFVGLRKEQKSSAENEKMVGESEFEEPPDNVCSEHHSARACAIEVPLSTF